LPIKVDVTVAGAVESQPKPACRRTVEADHAVASGSGHASVHEHVVHIPRTADHG
jgi:hypothetical protein